MNELKRKGEQDMKDIMNVEEAAKILECNPETLRRAIRKKELKAARVGREYRISRYDLEEYWVSKGGGKLFPNGK